MAIKVDFSDLRQAIRTKHIIAFTYRKENGDVSERKLRPLALVYFSPVWLLMGWEEARQDFRNFRLDRMEKLAITDERFRDEKGKTLRDFKKKERIA